MTLRYPEVRVLPASCRLSPDPHLTHAVHPRFQNPTQDERDALEAYMYLTSRLYPCGECAAEFQALLKKFPPQVRVRSFFFADPLTSPVLDGIASVCESMVRRPCLSRCVTWR